MATRRRRAPAKKPKRSSRRAARPLLSSLSPDWYWEQDASLRFVRIDVQTDLPGERGLAARNLGRRPWETGICIEGGWDAQRARLKKRAPFREVLMWRDFDDGSRRYISASGEPVFDAKGRFAGYRGIGRDITRQKRGELLLRLQHTITRRLAEAAGSLEGIEGALRAVCETEGWNVGQFWRLDTGARVMRRFAHWVVPGLPGARRFADAAREAQFTEGAGLVGAAWRSGEPLWIPDATQDPRALRKALAEETGVRAVLLCPIRVNRGVVGVLSFNCDKIRPPDHALLQALTAIATQLGLYLRRMDSEARMRESEARFRSLTHLSSDWFWEQDAQYRFTRLEGRNAGQDYADKVLGMRCWDGDLEVEGGWPAYREQLDQRATFHDVLMWRRAPDGMRYVRISGEPRYGADGSFAGYRGVGRDVSAQKRAEESLRESEERFRRTFELAGSGVAHVGLDRRFLRVNRKLAEILGYAESELIGRPVTDFSHPDDNERTNVERLRLFAGEIDSLSMEKRYIRKDGRVVWANLTLAAERDAEGHPQYGIAVYDDITARKAAEAALQESEARFRRTFELAGSGVAHVGMDGRFLRVNRRVCDMFGYPESELVGRSVKELSHPDDRDVTDAERARIHRGEIELARFQKRYLRKDDSTLWIEMSVTLERDAAGTPLYEISVLDDIGPKKRDEQLLRLERTVALLFSESIEAPAALKAAIRAICESESWECGRYLQVDETAAVLRLAEAWSVSSPDIERYIEISRDMVYGAGVGLAGVVWQSGEPQWVADIRDDPRVARKALARETGLRGAFAFPVLLKGAPIGVFIFQSREMREPDLRLLQAMRLIGSQIGLFMQRAQAERAMRESEARFRSLTELSSDWFWEQDADYRFTRLEGRRVAGGDTALRAGLIGTRRWDSGLQLDGGWDAHRALLDARQPFHDLLMWRRMSDGRVRYVRVSGEPIFAANGAFAGYRGVGRDVTEEKRAEQLLRLEHQVARALADAADESGGLQAVIRAVCEAEGWVSGRYLKAHEEAGVLRYHAGWSSPTSGAAQLLERSPSFAYRPGEGLSGICWQTGEPVWSADTQADPRVAARSLTEGTGIRGVFAFPAVSDGKPIGVLSFASHSVREPDERLLQASRVIGSQVGQFLRRMGAEENMRRFRLGMDNSADMILLIDVAAMRFIDVNSTACSLLGYTREELLAMGPQDVLPVSREELTRSYEALIASPATVGSMQSHYLCKDGSKLPFESTRRVLRSGGRPMIVAISRDVRERLAAEEALRESEARFRALTEMSSDFYWETDARHVLTDMTYGRGASGKLDNALGRAAWEVPSTHPDEAGWAALRAKVDAHQPFRDFEFGRPRHGGGVRYFSVSGEPRFDAQGSFAGYRGVGRDITEVVLARERIASLAYHDALTGLANRASLAPALEQAVERTRRRGSKLAGVFLDLDGFKQINDAHGHDAGDRLLVEAAQRLRAALRSSDPVARLGGDEFFVVLEDLQSNAPAERVARKLLAAILEPYDLGEEREARISASIGISVFPDDAGDAATLIKHADAAMYHAKQAGKNAYRFFAAGPAANDGRAASAGEETL